MATKKLKETIICASAEIQGNVAFGEGTSPRKPVGCIVHPHCNIIAEGGPIIIGNYNIIEERVTIINKGMTREKDGKADQKALYIGDYNLFEVGAIVDSSHIGCYNVLESKCTISSYHISIAYVKKGSSVGNNCIVTVCSATTPAATIPDYSIVLENGNVIQRPDPSEVHLKLNIECIGYVCST